jgi:hypothetical protein
MPTAASITVKKADTTTDIVYDLITASGGDNSPFVVRQDTGAVAGLPVGLRSTFKQVSKWNGPKTARVITSEGVMPYATQDTTTTLYSSKDRVVYTSVITMPQGIPSSVLNEVAQMLNLQASLLIKQAVQAGYAPT